MYIYMSTGCYNKGVISHIFEYESVYDIKDLLSYIKINLKLFFPFPKYFVADLFWKIITFFKYVIFIPGWLSPDISDISPWFYKK